MAKVTVIMPCLNVARYIDKCMASVVNQTLHDIEIIVVDAGSTDGTLEIIKKYAANDERIQLVNSPKKSYGYQLNLAASMAKGEYIGIVETDDYVEGNMYEVLYENIHSTDADYIKAGWRGFFSRNGAEWSYDDMPCELLTEKKSIVMCPRDNPSLFITDCYIWSGIYKRDFFKMFRLQETPGAAFQDVGMLFQIIHEAEKGIYLKEVLYNYRHDNEGASFHNPNSLKYIKNEYQVLRALFPNLSKEWEYIFYRQMSGHVYGRFFAMATQGVIVKDDYETQWLRDELSGAMERHILQKEKYIDFSWNSLCKYIEGAEKLSIFLQEFFKPLLKVVDQINIHGAVIFGCKAHGRYINTIFHVAGLPVHAFCDNNKNEQSKEIDNIKVVSPEESAQLYPEAVYVLTSERYASSMGEQLLSLGINRQNIITEWKSYLSPKHTLWAMIYCVEKTGKR